VTAAAFRAIGIDAAVLPPSDERTLELAGLFSSGEECLPHRLTLGDCLKICRAPDSEPTKLAFLMPSAPGPCRFGQYAPYLRQVLGAEGFDDVLVFSPTSADGYGGFGDHASELMRTMWMGLVAGDIATKLLLQTRPYETRAGDADRVFQRAIEDFQDVLSVPGVSHKQRLHELQQRVEEARDRFRRIPARYTRERPLVGLVGEIFCRLNTFSNEDVARRVERLGGECWLSDTAEWVMYTNWSRETEAARTSGRLSRRYLKHRLKTLVQRRMEQALYAPLAGDFRGSEEPHDVREILQVAEPYLPAEGALGEMVLSVGKAIYLHGKGVDGVLDISPFTCMNGIVSEAVYPAVSADHDDIPIRVCYFDKAMSHIDRDLEIFLDLARAYAKRKRHARVYPAHFE
jgi:predicted nucleotide-binding protein (sugar kinase/HSP70/actin superfamily)